MSAPSRASLTGSGADSCSRFARWVVKSAGMCCTISTGTGSQRGIVRSTTSRARGPPVDAASTITSGAVDESGLGRGRSGVTFGAREVTASSFASSSAVTFSRLRSRSRADGLVT